MANNVTRDEALFEAERNLRLAQFRVDGHADQAAALAGIAAGWVRLAIALGEPDGPRSPGSPGMSAPSTHP